MNFEQGKREVPHQKWRAALALLSALLLTCGIALELLSRLSVETFHSLLYSEITETHYQGFVRRAAFLALMMVFASITMFAVRRRLAVLISAVFEETRLWAIDEIARIRKLDLSRDILHWSTLAILLVLGSGLRLAYLTQTLRYDEAATYLRFASRPLWLAISDYSYPNNHIFHTLLVKLSVATFGASEWAIRIPALSAGIVLMALIYVAVRACYGRHAALITTSFVAASPPLVLYSTNARGYTLIALCFIVLIYLAHEILHQEGPQPWVPVVIVASIGLWTNPTMVYPVAIVYVWILMNLVWGGSGERMRKTSLALLCACGTTVLIVTALYIPVLLHSGPRLLLANQFVTPLSRAEFGGHLWSAGVSLCSQWMADVPGAARLLFWVGLASSWFLHRRIRTPQPLAACIVTIGALILIQRVAPEPRVLLFLLPCAAALSVAGLVFLTSRIAASIHVSEASARASGVPVTLVVLTLFATIALGTWRSGWVLRSTETGISPDAQALARFLGPALERNDIVLVLPPVSAPLRYYLQREGWGDRQFVAELLSPPRDRLFMVVDKTRSTTPLENLSGGVRNSLFQRPAPALVYDSSSTAVYLFRPNHGQW
jgi:dolichyl-phosphate-mannose-protein mannosyltransferase